MGNYKGAGGFRKQPKQANNRINYFLKPVNERLTVRKAKEAEMNFNLVKFVETLIAMDRQHQTWLQKQNDQPE